MLQNRHRSSSSREAFASLNGVFDVYNQLVSAKNNEDTQIPILVNDKIHHHPLIIFLT
jgi:hypothetical protein